MKQFIRATIALFTCLWMFFIPFPYDAFLHTGIFSGYLFNSLLLFLSEHVFKLEGVVPHIASDAAFMYLLVLVLLAVAMLLALGSLLVGPLRSRWNSWEASGRIIGYYFLALHLAKYGADKLFKAQFYLPEPNILYTPFGRLDPDILYWSTMGLSYPYSLFLGAAEVIAAVLLLFRRTRIAGLLAASVLLLNIVAVNFSFNISVKLFSLLLLALAVWLIAPCFRAMYRFIFLRQVAVMDDPDAESILYAHPFWRATGKTAAVLLILTEAVYPHLGRERVNDDELARPFLHGAYEVLSMDTTKEKDLKRIFIHRRGYAVFETQQGTMTDYKLTVDPVGRAFMLTDYRNRITGLEYTYRERDSVLVLAQPGNSVPVLTAKALDWRNLPALQPRFRWTIDVK